MLELPESYTIANQINEHLKGKIISYIELLHTPHRFAWVKCGQDGFEELLEGQTIEAARHQGGILEIDTEDSMLLLSDGSYPKYYEDKKKFPKNHQLAVYFDDDTAMFVSIQMYGFLMVFPKGQCEEGYYISSSTKPDPLTEEFSYEYFKSLYPANGKKLSAKAFLATEQRIPGLGNGVLQDILWDAGINPRFDMANATEEDVQTLYTSVRKILREMCDGGGRNTEKTLFGEKGGYVTQLSKNSLHEPCMRCGYEIHKAAYMGGTVYFCEHCQKRA
ncbi:MAG: endonuclease VIII [Lachnospiraceae bacterium]|nr:endonuclease VIII [Lachnospiraceae bacterium]